MLDKLLDWIYSWAMKADPEQGSTTTIQLSDTEI
jgi:hypothetical protein